MTDVGEQEVGSRQQGQFGAREWAIWLAAAPDTWFNTDPDYVDMDWVDKVAV